MSLGHLGKANEGLSCKQPNEILFKVVSTTARTTLCAFDDRNGLMCKAVMHFFKNKFYLFIFGCVGSLSVRAGFL